MNGIVCNGGPSGAGWEVGGGVWGGGGGGGKRGGVKGRRVEGGEGLRRSFAAIPPPPVALQRSPPFMKGHGPHQVLHMGHTKH